MLLKSSDLINVIFNALEKGVKTSENETMAIHEAIMNLYSQIEKQRLDKIQDNNLIDELINKTEKGS